MGAYCIFIEVVVKTRGVEIDETWFEVYWNVSYSFAATYLVHVIIYVGLEHWLLNFRASEV